MNELRDLYQEIILDHNKSPRNFHEMPDATHKVEGYNPLCGDRYTIFVKIEDGMVADVSFLGAGCAISKASASVMSSLVKGRSVEQARALFEQFHALVTTNREIDEAELAELGKLGAFAGVRDYPARVKCATLAWHTLHGALSGTSDSISTE